MHTGPSLTEATVINAVRDAAWTNYTRGRRPLAAEGLYGRRNMTALMQRIHEAAVSPGSVHRAMRRETGHG